MPFIVLYGSLLYGQPASAPAGCIIEVKTETGNFKGRLTNILDSSIEVTGREFNDKRTFPVSSIQLIKVKRPFLRNVTVDLVFGALAGGVITVAYYVKNYFYTPGDPPFGRALWTTMVFGASAGTLYDSIESAFVRIRIPVHKTQGIFENNKDRLGNISPTNLSRL